MERVSLLALPSRSLVTRHSASVALESSAVCSALGRQRNESNKARQSEAASPANANKARARHVSCDWGWDGAGSPQRLAKIIAAFLRWTVMRVSLVQSDDTVASWLAADGFESWERLPPLRASTKPIRASASDVRPHAGNSEGSARRTARDCAGEAHSLVRCLQLRVPDRAEEPRPPSYIQHSRLKRPVLLQVD